jgi:hypothetical protein
MAGEYRFQPSLDQFHSGCGVAMPDMDFFPKAWRSLTTSTEPG